MTRRLDVDKLESWRRRLTEFQQSGSTIAAFCRQEQITQAKFYYWARRVREAANHGTIQQPGSTSKSEACGSSSCSDPPTAELFIGSQIRMRLPATEPELIAAIVSSVGVCHSDDGRKATAAFQRIDLAADTVATRP